MLWIGALNGNEDPLAPLTSNYWQSTTANTKDVLYQATVRNNDDLTKALAEAKTLNQAVLLDFYATWCVSCKHIERHVLPDKHVAPLLKHFYLIKVDVSDYHREQRQLMRSYTVIAPPTFVFLTPDGNELTAYRWVGDMSAERFGQHLDSVFRAWQAI